MLNTCKADVCCFLSLAPFEGSPSIASLLTQVLPGTSSKPQIPTITNEVLASSVASMDIGRECPVRLAQTSTATNSVHVTRANPSTSTAC